MYVCAEMHHFPKGPPQIRGIADFYAPANNASHLALSPEKMGARESAYCRLLLRTSYPLNSAQNSEASTLLEKPCKPDHYHTYTSRMGVIEMTFATLYSSTEPRAFDILFYPK